MSTKRYSRQGAAVLNAVNSACDHPTAEMLYARLKETHPSISLGTVYRNLGRLSAEGSILKISAGVERYDGNVSPHPHFHCKSCGGLYDLKDAPSLSGLMDGGFDGHMVTGIILILEGICAKCRAES